MRRNIYILYTCKVIVWTWVSLDRNYLLIKAVYRSAGCGMTVPVT